jgi:Ig-like domain from next to BRCA1 gene
MDKQQRRLALISVLAILIFIACGVSTVQQSSLPVPAETLAAQTWSVMQTVAALSATPTNTPKPITDTPTPTQTPTNTSTPTSTNTPIPPLTERPTNTPQPTATNTVAVPTVTKIPAGSGGGTGGGGGGGGSGGGSNVPCLAAKLIRHVTIPDGEILPRNQSFVKVWRIQNIGSCTWNSSTILTPYGFYDPFFGIPVRLYQNVRPGKTIDIPVNLVTPSSEGNYTGLWVLESSDETFADQGEPFRVNVNVQDAPSNPIYDFTSRACQGIWQSNARSTRRGALTSSLSYGIRCPGRPNNTVGFVVQLTNPNTEAGSIVGFPGLWTNPPFATNGIIQGYFPALLIHSGDRFSAQVGCLSGNANCNVTFDLRYQIIVPPDFVSGENTITHDKVYDGSLFTYDVDLGSLGLTGQYVSFALRVRANNSSAENAAVWVAPRIVR